jgi:5-methyltetrahydropteroyltriglutamate--homocysteine methyltransferase
MDTLVDDIGSFPLPRNVERQSFSEAYRIARQAITNGRSIYEANVVRENFRKVIIDSFKKKLATGLDVVNFPLQYDGILQITDAIHKAMEKGSFVVEESNAFLPEVRLIDSEAKRLSEEFGGRIRLRVCLFGPMELYLKEIGTTYYADVLEGFAETIRRFAQNSILNSKCIKTEVLSIDEPSFGTLNITAENDKLSKILERSFNVSDVVRQIHLHSSTRLPDLLGTKNIDVLSFEYAASPKNIESVSKRMLDQADKNIRVGVSRTDIDALVAELHDQGIEKPSTEDIVESQDVIRKRYLSAKEKFGERMTFTGPDCGLGGWPSQEAAQLLLERTARAVKTPNA